MCIEVEFSYNVWMFIYVVTIYHICSFLLPKVFTFRAGGILNCFSHPPTNVLLLLPHAWLFISLSKMFFSYSARKCIFISWKCSFLLSQENTELPSKNLSTQGKSSLRIPQEKICLVTPQEPLKYEPSN